MDTGDGRRPTEKSQVCGAAQQRTQQAQIYAPALKRERPKKSRSA